LKIPHNQKIFFLVIYLIVTWFSFRSQNDYNLTRFQHYRIKDGLPAKDITCITQDKRGFIWLGSENGISRFDGTSFTNYSTSDSILGLKNNYIKSLKSIGDSIIAILTPGGCNILNTYNMHHIELAVDNPSSTSGLNDCRSLVKCENGNYVLLTLTSLFEFNAKGKLLFRKDYKSYLSKMQNDFERKDIFNLGNNKLAVYSFNQFFIYEAGTHRYLNADAYPLLKKGAEEWNDKTNAPIKGVSRLQISDHEFLILEIQKDSIAYLNTRKNIFRKSAIPEPLASETDYFYSNLFCTGKYEFATPAFNGFIGFRLKSDYSFEFADKKTQADHFSNYIFCDFENRLWIGADDGLLKQTGVNSPVKKHEFDPDNKDELLNSHIFIGNEKIFISTLTYNSGNTLYVLDLKTKERLHTLKLPDETIPFGIACALQSYYKDTLWISTTEGILWMNMNTYATGNVKTPEEIKNTPVNFGKNCVGGKAWMHTYLKKWHICYDLIKREFTLYSPETSVKTLLKKPINITCAPNGNVWFYGYGLERWNNSKGLFDTLLTGSDKTSPEFLFDIVQPDEEGGLLIYCSKNGFVRYNPATGEFKKKSYNKKLAPKHFNPFSIVKNNSIWYGYDDLLINYNFKTESTVAYNQNEGMPDGSITGNICFDEESNTFFVCSGRTLLNFKPITHPEPKTKIQIDYISSDKNLTVFHPGDTVRFSYLENNLNIRFTTVDFGVIFPRRFSYQVDDHGSWNTSTSAQSVFLHDLVPGWHTVTIRSLDNPEKFLEKRLVIYIVPPFWKTMWFTICVIALILVLTIIVVRFFIKKAKKENQLLLQSKEFELKALHAQMNPHFIFNSLNSIKFLVINQKNKEASKYINDFSKLVRLNLSHSRKSLISLQENIDYINLYLEAEKLRFTNFTYETSVDEKLDTENIMVLPMLVQPIIENAIWHGLHSIQTERILKIRYEAYSSGVKCIIEDNGIGIKQSVLNRKTEKKDSVGMENIKDRIHLFNKKYKLNYKIEIEDKSDLGLDSTGTIVTIYFNTKTNYD
jgi:two-component sensor histidine kinase